MNGNGKVHNSRARLQPWPFIIVGIMVSFLAVQAVMVAMAARGFEGPDDPNYYADGLTKAILAEDRAEARARGWHLQLHVPARSGAMLRLRLTDPRGRPLEGARVSVQLGRPATKREDHAVPMARTVPGAYAGVMTGAPGPWDVTVTVRHAGGLLIRKLRAEIVSGP